MEYEIEYANGTCHNRANGRNDLLDWLKILKNETITDIKKISKDGTSQSVMDKYKKYVKN